MNLDTDAHPHLKRELQGFSKQSGFFCVCIEGRFESSHYLYNYMPDGSDEPIHGHSWLVEVELAQAKGALQDNGISLDFLALRQRLDTLLERIEHLCINDLEEFQGVNPTAENIARWFYQGLLSKAQEQKASILELRIHEGPGNVAIFRPKHNST